MDEINKLIVIVILSLTLLGSVLYIINDYTSDKQEQKELEIYFNGTNQGATNVINFIAQNNAVPFFLPDGNVTYITFTRLCEELNNLSVEG